MIIFVNNDKTTIKVFILIFLTQNSIYKNLQNIKIFLLLLLLLGLKN